MAKKPEIIARYTVSLDELLQKGGNLTAAARRDLSLPNKGGLDDFGYTADQLAVIEAAGEVVSEMPTDDEFVGVVTETTDLKDGLADQLREQIDGLVARAISFYGDASGKVRRYGADKLSKMTDGQLWQCAKRAVRVGKIQLNDLKAKGLTQEYLNTLVSTYTKFDAARDDQDDAIRERDIATQERIMAANAYYAQLQRLGADGQAHFVAKDEARYNDYVWEPAPGEPSGGGETPVPPPK